MSAASPGIIVKASEQEFADWIATESGFLEGLVTFEDKPLELEHFQRNFLDFRDNDGREPRFVIVNKARQVGYSFLFAAISLARCHLRPNYRAIHVSYNMEDAKQKIWAAQMLFEGLPAKFQKKLVVDSKTELAFESPSGGFASRSRIISHPARPPRGRNGDVFLDELAHVPTDNEIYAGATALILRSRGQLVIASTPLGQRGKFWEIYREEIRRYERFSRFFVPWWYCGSFCVDIERAVHECPSLSSEERVRRFGTEDMQDQFSNLPLQDFQQEFEGDFVDEATSYFPYELILPCTFPELEPATNPDEIKPPRPDTRLTGGVDIGRTHDKTVISLFEEKGEGAECSFDPVFFSVLNNVPFREQEDEVRRILSRVPVSRMSIDNTGMGKPLAENLARDFPNVEAFDFSNQSKERLATDMKILLQQKRIRLPRRRDMIADIHAIRRKTSASGNVLFDSERTAAGHSDMFWSIALACQLNRTRYSGGGVRARVLG